METRKLTLSALLIAIGTLAGQFIYIPLGVAKYYPIQHTINVLSAVWLGPWHAVLNAFSISLLRNILGSGTFLAFPGSMIGACLAGILYIKFGKQNGLAILGELIGTGLIGGLLAFPVAKLLMGREIAAFAFVIPFLISSLLGCIIAYLILLTLKPLTNK